MRLFTIALIGNLVMAIAVASHVGPDNDVTQIVAQHIRAALQKAGPGGAAVAVRADGRTSFFNYGMADRTQPITSDVLFNLGLYCGPVLRHPAGLIQAANFRSAIAF